ncbi:hypothetical protein EWM64_g2444 [Hericium alpestre]|uniref:Peptidase A1 domain-containing protein n=1 Tax=Hericium alpestre TaxID=135208 RepID=A0A4Z0A551_9AGAM|nr:hypothetical protein EWM64_g2444 [Hericium alpestre]
MPTPGVINFDINLTNGGGLTRSLAYMASIKLANESSDKEFWVQLDTGSSDLWIQVDDLPVKGSYDKDPKLLNITHGQSLVTGNMSYASVTFAGFSIPQQFLLQANNSFNFGSQGVLGLGFDANSSLVGQYMADHDLDHKGSLTLITNIIDQNFAGSKGPGFVTLDVNRSPDVEASQMIFNDKNTTTIGGGTLTIGSVLPEYESAMDSAPHLSVPQRPSDSEDGSAFFDFWHVPLDGVVSGEQKHDVSADRVDGNPNMPTALIDSGSSLSFISKNMAQFIYSSIDNNYKVCRDELWLVPCTSMPDVSFTFGGQNIRIDPLALTDVVQFSQDSSDHFACVGTFRADDTPEAGTPYSYILGDPFLRSVYTRFDYGSATIDNDFTDPPAPFISFVSKVNGADDTIKADFTKTREQTLQFFADKKMTALQPNEVNCDSLAAYYV